jgi:hypothetical protein
VVEFAELVLEAQIRVLQTNAQDLVELAAEITNFLCSAALNGAPAMLVKLRPCLSRLLTVWNEKYQKSRNSVEPDGNTCLNDTCRLVAILLGSSMNHQLLNPGRPATTLEDFNSLGNLTEYADSINLSDISAKLLDIETPGSPTVVCQIDPDLHNLAFGEKLFAEAEAHWKRLFRDAKNRDWPAADPEEGGERMKRFTRILLAAFLNHNRDETLPAIYRQVFLLREQVFEVLRENQTPTSSDEDVPELEGDNASTMSLAPVPLQPAVAGERIVAPPSELQLGTPWGPHDPPFTNMLLPANPALPLHNNSAEQQPALHPFFNQNIRNRRPSSTEDSQPKRARTQHDEASFYTPILKKALYLLLCINSNQEPRSISDNISDRRSSITFETITLHEGAIKQSSSDVSVRGHQPERRNSFDSAVRFSRSESLLGEHLFLREKPLQSAVNIGEHIRREKEKQAQSSRMSNNQTSKMETLAFKQIIEFINAPSLDPESMLKVIQWEENTAKSRIEALQELHQFMENGFLNQLCETAHRAFLVSVFGLLQNPLERNPLDHRLHHYLQDVAHARPALKSQITRVWKELTAKLLQQISSNNGLTSASDVYTLCGLTLKWLGSDIALLENIALSTINCLESTEGVDTSGLSIMTPQLLLQLNFGQLKVDGLHQIASVGMSQSILLAVGIYGSQKSPKLLKLACRYLLTQLSEIWDSARPSKKRETFETCLAELLALINRVMWNEDICKECANLQWTLSLLQVIRMDSSGVSLIKSLRPRLLAIEVMKKISPFIEEEEIINQCVDGMMTHLYESHWVPLRLVNQDPNRVTLKRLSNCSNDIECEEISGEVGWNTEQVVSCTIDNTDANVLCHSTGGRGYGIAAESLSSGRHVWKIDILNEARGNEGTCIGISKLPVTDHSHRTTTDMWLYRAYSGHIYHGGEIGNRTLQPFTQDDSITCILDTDARTLSFAKNDSEPVLAFEDLPVDVDFYPVVTFYSSSPGEKVRISSMITQGIFKDLGTN